jgi:hypothetical protein
VKTDGVLGKSGLLPAALQWAHSALTVSIFQGGTSEADRLREQLHCELVAPGAGETLPASSEVQDDC